jgi:histidine decarboxylase
MRTLIPLTYEMRQFYWRLQANAPFMLGYPGNLNNDFSELNNFFDFIINNVGDPSCIDASYKMHSKKYELRVIDFFKEIYNFNHNVWGYITNGGTESNIMGLLLARSKYPNGTIYSTNGHYSIKKNSIILNMPYVEIKSSISGEIDYNDLLAYLLKDKNPPIINLTIGTTFDGAIDSVDKTLNILRETGHENFYIHCDAALFGGFIPFLGVKHELDFRKPIDSISISAHKFFGVPLPSGIFLSKEKPHGSFVDCIEYIDSDDTTISGSRNGQIAIFLWALIENRGINGFREEAIQCIENAKYLKELLEAINYHPHLNENSNIVTFDIPSDKIINKWQLAIKGKMAHVVVMQHITKETVDSLISDIVTL